MFSPINKTQIFGFSPNNQRCYAGTSLLQHKKTLFAFAADNIIFIFDRITLQSSVITTPDPSDHIISITFTGYDKNTSLFCVNKKGKLYSYLLLDPSKPILEANLGCSPTSITASNDHLFIKTGTCLYATPINNNWISTEKIILSETLFHEKCLVSPCGRGLATYTIGSKNPVIWYSPFERRRRGNLPIDDRTSSFAWATSEHLMAVTSTEEGIVRLWAESTTSYELRCVKWFDFGCRVLSTAICTSSDVECQIQLKNCQRAASESGRVFPTMKRPRVLIMSSIEKNNKTSICFLQEKALPQLEMIAKASLTLEEAQATYCDMRRIFSDNELKRMVSAVRFTQSSLSFLQFEIGTKLTHINPFTIDFIRSPITHIFKQSKILTQHENGVLYGWWKQKRISDQSNVLDFTTISNESITIGVTSKLIYFEENQKTDSQNPANPPNIPFTQMNPQQQQQQQHLQLNSNIQNSGQHRLDVLFENPVNFATILKIGEKTALIVATNRTDVYVYVYSVEKKDFKRITVNNTSSEIVSATIHSTDLFVLSTKKSVDSYFYVVDHFEKHATLEVNSKSSCPCSLFIPHPLALIAISFKTCLKFFILWYNCFLPIDEFDKNLKSEYSYPLFSTMTLTDDKVILASSKHLFCELRFSESDFPSPYKLDCSYVLLSSFTLGYFYQLHEILSGHEITIDSFKIKMASESFIFPQNPPPGIHKMLATCCQKPPQNWGVLDECGLRFLFSWTISKNVPDLWKYIPLFGVWALLSRDQSTLITSLKLRSAKMIFDMMLPLWAKDKNVLIKAMNVLIEETVPSDNEVDVYFLFCILLNKRNIAKKIARVKNQEKLANFFGAATDDAKMRTRIEKSAFEAQKQHRTALSAMFFCMKSMTKQALIVLRSDPMLLVIAARILGEEETWGELIDPKLLNGFYFYWWQKKNDEAKKALNDWSFTRSSMISIELHRLEILKKLGLNNSFDILGIQFTQGFVEMQLLQTSKVEDLVSDDENDQSVQSIFNDNKSQKNKKKKGKNDDNDNFDEDNDGNEEEEEEGKQKGAAAFDFGYGMAEDDWDEDAGYDAFSDEDEDDKEDDGKENGGKDNNKLGGKQEEEDSSSYFESNFHEVSLLPPFNSPEPLVFTLNEKLIVFIISTLLNDTYNEESLKLISKIAEAVYTSSKPPCFGQRAKKKVAIVIAILYTLTLALSKANMMMTLFMKPFNPDVLQPLVTEFMSRKAKIPNGPPNILKRFVTSDVVVKDSDRNLANFISFHEICKILIQQGSVSRIQMLISFFHHRHRLLFSRLQSFYFSESNYVLDMSTIGLKCNDLSDRMHETLMNRKWLVSIINPFISPFYFGDRFQASLSFEKATKLLDSSSSSSSSSLSSTQTPTSMAGSSTLTSSSPLSPGPANSMALSASSSALSKRPMATAICINSKNQSEIAVASKHGIEFIDLSKKKKNSSSASGNENNHSSHNSQPQLFFSHPQIPQQNQQQLQQPSQQQNLMQQQQNSHQQLQIKQQGSSSGEGSSSGGSIGGSHGGSSGDITPFDSPFAALMSPANVKRVDSVSYTQKREFQPQWKKDRTSIKDLPVTCLAAHPHEPLFVAGTKTGRIYLSTFGPRYSSTMSSVMYSESPVTSISLNETGDRLLSTTKDGYIYVNDFSSANLFASVEGATAAWLNCDTQIIVCEPMNHMFVIYDIIAGLLPVASYKIKQRSSRMPIAVCGHQVLTGHENGSIVQLDLRNQQYVTMELHKSPVSVIKFDPSQRFFVSGSADNSLRIVNARIDAAPQALNDVFSSYDPKGPGCGVTDVALSDQTIVACGYSNTIHAWTVNDPHGLYF